ncbi:MAG: SEC-C domain-containing protein [Mesorhizobium sp.]|uniref:SEC-C domain-containing protein n=1 Tax=Mesorhizobium sp. TaxID=1871066 RepID=UPI001ACA6C5E|nr:SEC-C domain-containing protein [Mesorhizobium sp.]MBN9220930.1 SEC-C domain-containing protein [Mesorhizobium sp.]
MPTNAKQFCPCGSGRAYHACHGHYLEYLDLMSPRRRSLERVANDRGLPAAILSGQRREYGCGKPMESWVEGGRRHVRVGAEVFTSHRWRNFTDFLLFFLQHSFGIEWGDKQKALPIAEAHPVYRQFLELRSTETGARRENGLYSTPATGTINAYISLAYDLYLCAHNQRIPNVLLDRLKSAIDYEGALYEIYVAGLLSRAGFRLDFENEKDKRRTHCEFTATNIGTGAKFSVEAKAVTSRSARSGQSASPPNFRGKLFDAFSKRADHMRIVFLEINRQILPTGGGPEWAPYLVDQVRKAERDMFLEDGRRPDPAYLFVTNRPFLSQRDPPAGGYECGGVGFRIADFPPEKMGHLYYMQHARMKHIEAYQLFCAMHQTVPVQQHFDDDPLAAVFRGFDTVGSDDIRHPLDAFDFMFSVYRKSEPEQLREWLADLHPHEQLQRMNQMQLAELYCACVGQSMVAGRGRGASHLNE